MNTLRHIICGWVLLLLPVVIAGEGHAQAGLPLDPDKALSQYHLDAWGIDDGTEGADGSLWVGTYTGGLNHLRDGQVVETLTPENGLEAAIANGNAFQTDSLAVVPPGVDKFEFHYAGLSLLAPEKVRFRYLLEGIDEDWVEAGARREAFYTNLAPGRYTFKVMARNNDGVWNDEAATASFYLKPYFHQTPLFYVLCALGLVLLVLTGYRLRVRRLKRRERELVHLVKELVELHGGVIRAESPAGEGSTFIVTLPKDTRPIDTDVMLDADEAVAYSPMVEMAVFDDEERVPAAPPEESGSVELPPDRPVVLIVDDNPEIRAYVAGCLDGTYRVVQAVDGQDALDTMHALQPDLVISDVMMPNMTGYELCRAVKGDEGLRSTPVILLTSRASLDEKIQGLEAGADDYLTKPFSARELLIRVRNLLNLNRHQRALEQLNEDLRQTNEELREASEMKSQLLRIAAHDLKNPLNGIREFAKILKGEVPATATNQELLNLIHTSSDQMLDMISKLLDSEALESGQLVLDKEPVSAVAVAQMVVRRNRPQAERKGDQLILQLDPHDDCMVEAARTWLRDAMDNLLSNAIKYAPMNTRIWIRVKRHGDVVRFSVRDEGPGLTDEDKTKLFGKFQRLSAVPTNDESSTGLGLSIVKQIVDLHGGRVWAESEHGHGATFTIELALAKPIRKARLTTTPIPG